MPSIPAVEASANVRRALKSAFPGVRFSVRTNVDVCVSWTDGPTRPQVEAALKAVETGSARVDLDRRHSSAVPAKATALWEEAAGHAVPTSGWLRPIAVCGYRVTEGTAYYQLGVIADLFVLKIGV